MTRPTFGTEGSTEMSETATQQKNGISGIKSSDLPMTAHTTALGVDITAHQEAMWAEVHEDGHRGGLDPDIEIAAWQGEPFFRQHIRHEIAEWARRNLFNGAGPQ